MKAKTESLKNLEVWNRKIHYYLGLYLLFFIWLFAFSGLLLNNSGWNFFEFWEKRKESAQERAITTPPLGSDLAQANDLMRQLGLSGEVEWTASRGDNNRLNFRVTRPGHVIDVNAAFQQKRATVKRIDYNAWGLMRTLHTFTGASVHDNRNQRDWFLTKVWAFTMDAVAAGLIRFPSLASWLRTHVSAVATSARLPFSRSASARFRSPGCVNKLVRCR